MTRIFAFLGHRLLFVVPQLFGILLVSFVLMKSIPGDPAVLMLGPMASAKSVAALRAKLGLDQSLPEQFWRFLDGVAHGDLGTSWQTTEPVLHDLLQRFPATLELVTLGLLGAILIGVPLGVASAFKERGPLSRVAALYGLTAGSLPDFWLALVLIFVLYTKLHIVPAPLGRLDPSVLPPPTVTGFLIIDSIAAGDWAALRSVAGHLVLPVLTLSLISAGPILKMTQSTMERMLQSQFSRYEVLSGLPHQMVVRHALRNSLPSVVTIISVLYGFLLGGAVLVEIVFGWGGAGQYAVQGVLNSDIYPVLGFVLFSAIFSLVVYLIVDILYVIIDPRIGR